jgi:hypothetical protein
MSNVLWAVIGAVSMWALIGALYTWKEETSNNIVYNVLDYAIALPWVVLAVVFVIISYPFLLIWKFIRNAVRPVSQEAWDKCKFKHYFKIGNFRVVYDERARAFCNKLFLVRIAHPSNHIVHDPVVITHNEPSVPDGEFR